MSSVAVFPQDELSPAPDTPEKKRARAFGALAINSAVRPASALEIRPAPEMVPFGIPALDALTGGVPRGALTELVGPASSGRTSIMLALMAEVTRRQEVCALVDVNDSFDPASAEAAGVDLKRVLWIRCGKTSSHESEFTDQAPSTRSSKRAKTFEPQPKTTTRGTMAGSNAQRVHQAITSGCFEAARGRREPVISNVAPPAKNISWSIHENYDSRLRHAMVNGGESYKSHQARNVISEPLAAAKNPQPAKALQRNFAQLQKAKWDRLDKALKATDLLIQSGGFGLILIDLGDIPPEQARRIPLTSWFRFRRAVENTPTILTVIARDSCAKTCASLVMQLSARARSSGDKSNQARLAHVCLLDGLDVHVELLRTRLERKPVRSAAASLETRTSWKKSG